MKQYSFYNTQTGILHPKILSTNTPESVTANTPAAHIAIEGALDSLSQRFDLATSKVVDYQPPLPSPSHEWNATTKRWQLSAAAAGKIAARKAALAQIARLEETQHRPLRELMLGDETARTRLKEIEIQIVALRASL